MMVGPNGTTLTLESKSPFDLRLDQSREVTESAVKKALRAGDMGFLHSFTTGSTVDGPRVRVVKYQLEAVAAPSKELFDQACGIFRTEGLKAF